MQTTPCFMVDHMVRKLGKYLRICGYDAVWDDSLRTHELIQRANREGRVFLTRNGRLAAQYPPVRDVWTVRASDPVAQLHEVAGGLDLDLVEQFFSACVRCNVPLESVPDKRAIVARVHPNVYRRHDRFFTCPHCGTVFWHGSHVANTCRKLALPLPTPGAAAK